MKLYDVIQKEYPKKEAPSIEDDSTVDHPLVHNRERKPKKKRIIFFSLLGIFLALLYIGGMQFTRAKVIVEERVIPFTLDNTIVEVTHETETDQTRLSFQTMKVDSEIHREIFGSELKQVTGKAKGAVVFFNEYSASPQTIKMSTRLTATNGKTYITQATAIVPGYTIDKKTKKKTPGTSASVSVIATDAGASYNSQGTSLTINGFSGAKKQQLYARSVGAFTGGESGMMHTVSDAERPQLIESLKTQLSERLRRETRAQIPNTLVTYPDLQFISINTDSLGLTGEGVRFSAKISGSMTSYLISRKLLEQSIAKEVLKDNPYTSVVIPDIETLSVVPESAIPTAPDKIPETISIKITGEGKMIAQIAPETVRTALIGARRRDFAARMASFAEIQNARFSLYPFWSPFFPKVEKRIFVDFE